MDTDITKANGENGRTGWLNDEARIRRNGTRERRPQIREGHSAAKPQKEVAQVSQPAVSPISNRQGVENTWRAWRFARFAGWKPCDTAGWETGATPGRPAV